MLKSLFGCIATAAMLVSAPALAGGPEDRAVVEAFYTDLLSNPSGDDLPDRVERIVAADWVTIPAGRNGPGAEGFAKTLAGFGQLIPDLTWEIEEILVDGDRYVVRGRATGTPVTTFFGIEPSGKSFEIMSIDIHTVEDGRIVQSYHVEEWATAMRQLAQ